MSETSSGASVTCCVCGRQRHPSRMEQAHRVRRTLHGEVLGGPLPAWYCSARTSCKQAKRAAGAESAGRPTPEPADASATLRIGHSDSHCGACGGAAFPYEETHTTPAGYHPQPGCGVRWTHVESVYAGADYEKAVREMRPDLIFGRPSPSGDSGPST